jgi:hypothetical protein
MKREVEEVMEVKEVKEQGEGAAPQFRRFQLQETDSSE